MHGEKHSSAHDAELARRALIQGERKQQPDKPKREMHVRELHSGGYHIVRRDEEGNTTEHATPNVDGLHDQVHEHFGPGEVEQEGEA